jgi:hypothetical protein
MSEKRLIDANALPYKIAVYAYGQAVDCVFKSDIRKAPTIDAVEVVRCACCISFMEYTAEYTQAVEGADGDCRIRMNFSDYPDYYAVKKDDYCSHGTRKEPADGTHSL